MSKPNPNTLTIIWGALLLSQGVYLVVAHILEIEQSQPEMSMILPLCVIGGLNAIFAFALPSFLKNGNKLSLSIIQYALLESCSLIGFACSFLGADFIYQYGLAFLGMGGMILLYPKASVKGRVEP